MEIKNNLIVTKEEGGKGTIGKGHKGTYIYDIWTKPKKVVLRVGHGDEWGGGAW